MSAYLIIAENGYDASNVMHCESYAELERMLKSTDGYHSSFPVDEIEVYEVARELPVTELQRIKSKG